MFIKVLAQITEIAFLELFLEKYTEPIVPHTHTHTHNKRDLNYLIYEFAEPEK